MVECPLIKQFEASLFHCAVDIKDLGEIHTRLVNYLIFSVNFNNVNANKTSI